MFDQLNNSNIRVEIDSRTETMQAKIRDAQLQKIPYMLIIGKREEAENKIAVRTRGGSDLGVINLDDFLEKIKLQIESRSSL